MKILPSFNIPNPHVILNLYDFLLRKTRVYFEEQQQGQKHWTPFWLHGQKTTAM